MVPMQVGGIGHGSPPWIPRSPNAAIAAVASNGFGSPFIVIIMLLKMIRNGRTTRLLEVVETPLYGVSSATSNQYRYLCIAKLTCEAMSPFILICYACI